MQLLIVDEVEELEKLLPRGHFHLQPGRLAADAGGGERVGQEQVVEGNAHGSRGIGFGEAVRSF